MPRTNNAATAFVAAALVLGCAGQLTAQNQGDQVLIGSEDEISRIGTRGANFLEIPVGAREVALAGAGTVSARGVNSMFWNPGALALSEQFSIGISYTELFEGSDIGHFYGGALLPLLGGVFGVSINALTSGDIERTTEPIPSGELRTLGRTFDWTSTAIGGYYSRLITDRLGVGAGLKFIEEGINEASAQWVGADVGIRFETGLYGTVLGASIANLGSSSNFEGSAITALIDDNDQFLPTGRDLEGKLTTNDLELPTYFRFGVGVDLAGSATSLLSTDPRHRVAAFVDLRDAVDTAPQPTVALEYSFNDILFLRGGKFWRNEFLDRDFDDGLAGGLGLNVPIGDRRLSFGYAYSPGGTLGSTQTFTVNFEN